MATFLFILNGPPYGTEGSYNGLRLAGTLVKRDSEKVRVFLMGDAASCAKRDQKVPPGYYNIELMIKAVTRAGGQVGVCGTCMDARGLTDQDLQEGTHRSSMTELTDWTVDADKTLVF